MVVVKSLYSLLTVLLHALVLGRRLVAVHKRSTKTLPSIFVPLDDLQLAPLGLVQDMVESIHVVMY